MSVNDTYLFLFYHIRRSNLRTIHVTNDELYEFVKLYDLLRDMDFELTEKQTNVFDKILIMEGKS